SIKQAAADLGKSYRHVWGRIKQAEAALGRPLVETRVGGRGTQRSCLTPEAERLVAAFRTFRPRMMQLLPQEFARCFRRAPGKPLLPARITGMVGDNTGPTARVPLPPPAGRFIPMHTGNRRVVSATLLATLALPLAALPARAELVALDVSQREPF